MFFTASHTVADVQDTLEITEDAFVALKARNITG
jgi:hypothetical protein